MQLLFDQQDIEEHFAQNLYPSDTNQRRHVCGGTAFAQSRNERFGGTARVGGDKRA